MSNPFHLNERTGHYLPLRPLTRTDIIQQALRLVQEKFFRRSAALTSPQLVRDYLILKFADIDREVFGCLYLDNRHRVIAYEALFQGTINACSVHSREVVKGALRLNAAAVIFAHNHPSGDPEPSNTDVALTKQLREALSLIDVRTLDHIVVGGRGSVSLAERGLL